MTFTTKPKHKKQTSPTDYSITKSYLFSIEQTLGLDSLFNDNIKHVNFDCPTNLRDAFKLECRSNGTSTCKELTKYMANYVCTSRIKKTALSPTINRILDANFSIGEINFTQNVQNRPRRFNHNNPATVIHDELNESRCGIGDCENEATEFMIYQPKGKDPKEYHVCNLHFHDLLKTDFSGKFWRAKR